MSSDRHAHWDAAYVLGALSAAERQEYEDHLTSCPSCRDAVAELGRYAGAARPGADGRGARHGRASRGSWWLRSHRHRSCPCCRRSTGAGGSTCSSQPSRGCAGRRRAGRVRAVRGSGGDGRSACGDVHCRACARGLLARVGVVDDRGARRRSAGGGDAAARGVPVRAQDARRLRSGGAWAEYAIWVVDREGRAVLQKAWSAKPDRVMRPTAASPLAPDDIAAVEIRRVDTGETVPRRPRVTPAAHRRDPVRRCRRCGVTVSSASRGCGAVGSASRSQ